MEKMRKISTWTKIGVGLFFAVLLVVPVVSAVLPDMVISKSERRKLAQIPEFTFEAFWDGSYTEQLEEYLKDQFAGRDMLRTTKAEMDVAIFRKSDSDGYYKVEDAIYQRKEILQEKNVRWAAEHFVEIAETYFPDADVYYAVIPDKEEYLEMSAEAAGGNLSQSEQAEAWMAECMPKADCISLWDTLSLEDYYRTDIHWRQECIMNVAETLAAGMKETTETIETTGTIGTTETIAWTDRLSAKQQCTSLIRTVRESGEEENDKKLQIATERFLGGNACASAFLVAPETMEYVTSSVIEKAVVYDYEKKAQVPVYSWEKLEEGTDPYDFYLWGARALLTIENPEASEEAGRLLLFRDSFGSSLAPLLVKDYAQITMVDLRYVTMDYAAELLGDRDYDDVLFLYSTSMLNHSGTLRFS